MSQPNPKKQKTKQNRKLCENGHPQLHPATKKCRHQHGDGTTCGAQVEQSTEQSDIEARARRATQRKEKEERKLSHCSICLDVVKVGQRLGLGLCSKEEAESVVDGVEMMTITLAPCGKATHFECLEKYFTEAVKVQGDYGRLPPKCVYCAQVCVAPYYFEVFGPFGSR